MRPLLPLLLLFSLAAHAGDELSPDKVGQLEHDQLKAEQAIDKKHGNKPSSELSDDERRQIIQEKAAADQSVLDKAGVDRKDFARGSARLSRGDRARADATEKALEKKDAEAAKAKPQGGNQIVIEHGTGEEVNEAAQADQAMGLGHEVSVPTQAKRSKKHRRR
jgi:hypothetical protein